MIKTKRLFAMALSLVMVISAAVGFSGCAEKPVQESLNNPVASLESTSGTATSQELDNTEDNPTVPHTEPVVEDMVEEDEAAECPYCDGPHYLSECPDAKEARENKDPEPRKCVYCGETDCPYLETGDMTKCKAYDPKKDPAKYCQYCGKSVSVCQQWFKDKNCPDCGAYVPARTCHTCTKK